MSPGVTERETELLDLLREETARHCRFQRDVEAALADIIRSQVLDGPGADGASRYHLMGTPDGWGRRIHTESTALLAG